MDSTFAYGVATGIVATLIVVRIAWKMKDPFETWLARKIQAVMAKQIN